MNRNRRKEVFGGYSSNEKFLNLNKLSCYDYDNSINYSSIFFGLISFDERIRSKSARILILNLEKTIASDEFADLVTLFISCFVFLYFYTYLFFNVTEFIKYILK